MEILLKNNIGICFVHMLQLVCLLRTVKPSLEKEDGQQAAVGLSLLVDLAIDFFSAK